MKGPLDRTKVVLRHLPPTISQSALMEPINVVFAGRYNWVSFRPGKSSQKHQMYSRAYIDFNRPEDVIEFAEFFDGHVFVNEKGTQCKTVVEYAPSQRVPKHCSKKDAREGTLLKDPEFLEFLELIAKPVENLPSAEIQLERREAERAGAAKDAPIITPLMDFVRQKRAAKGGSRRSLSGGKPSRRSSGAQATSMPSKRGSEKKKYILRDSMKATSGKDKSTYILIPKCEDPQLSGKSATSAAVTGTDAVEGDNGVSEVHDAGRKKILLLKGKEKELSQASGGLSRQQSITFPSKNSTVLIAPKQSQRREGSGRIIRSILLNRDTPPAQTSFVPSEASTFEKDKRPPRPPQARPAFKEAAGAADDSNDMHGVGSDKRERRTRNRDRPDRGVWAPLRRPDGLYISDDSQSLAASQSVLSSSEGGRADQKTGVIKILGSGRGSHSSDNGSYNYKHAGRRMKDSDGFSVTSDLKPPKRGPPSYCSHEKQVWVQKSTSGS